MLTLVIDTASNRGLVGLVEDGMTLAEHVWDVRSTYSQELLGQIDALLEDGHRPRTAVERIVVDVGPGGYGSLRVGVATAQGLALGLDVPLAGVGRLMADAARYIDGGRPVVSVHNAGSSGIAWAAYAAGEGSAAPVELIAPCLGSAEECADSAPPGALWCGELNEDLRAAARARGLDIGPREDEQGRRALDLVRLAEAAAAFRDPSAVDVFYLRPPAITQPRT